jgi:ribosomal protein S18 acetylase RimI-like enzyme
MQVINSNYEDINTLFELYEAGTAYQKQMAKKHWEGFQRSQVEKEIAEKRQWKIVIDNEIACVFVTGFQDPFIWKEKDKDPAIYLHRIAINPKFRGQHFVGHIVAWAKQYAIEHHKFFIRMDTGAGNDKLNNYYISCGFTHLGEITYEYDESLPEHYKDCSSTLFEINLNTIM